MEKLTGAQWKAKYGASLGWSKDLLDKCAAGIDKRNAEYAANRKFWKTASYEEKERALLEDLAHTRCNPLNPKHNPNVCNSCGPINAALKLLKEGKL